MKIPKIKNLHCQPDMVISEMRTCNTEIIAKTEGLDITKIKTIYEARVARMATDKFIVAVVIPNKFGIIHFKMFNSSKDALDGYDVAIQIVIDKAKKEIAGES